MHASDAAGPADGHVAVRSMEQFSPDTHFMVVALAIDSWAKECGAVEGLPLDAAMSLAALRAMLTALSHRMADSSQTAMKQAVNKLLRLHTHWAKIVSATVKACSLTQLTVDKGRLTCELMVVWLLVWRLVCGCWCGWWVERWAGFDSGFDGGFDGGWVQWWVRRWVRDCGFDGAHGLIDGSMGLVVRRATLVRTLESRH